MTRKCCGDPCRCQLGAWGLGAIEIDLPPNVQGHYPQIDGKRINCFQLNRPWLFEYEYDPALLLDYYHAPNDATYKVFPVSVQLQYHRIDSDQSGNVTSVNDFFFSRNTVAFIREVAVFHLAETLDEDNQLVDVETVTITTEVGYSPVSSSTFRNSFAGAQGQTQGRLIESTLPGTVNINAAQFGNLTPFRLMTNFVQNNNQLRYRNRARCCADWEEPPTFTISHETFILPGGGNAEIYNTRVLSEQFTIGGRLYVVELEEYWNGSSGDVVRKAWQSVDGFHGVVFGYESQTHFFGFRLLNFKAAVEYRKSVGSFDYISGRADWEIFEYQDGTFTTIDSGTVSLPLQTNQLGSDVFDAAQYIQFVDGVRLSVAKGQDGNRYAHVRTSTANDVFDYDAKTWERGAGGVCYDISETPFELDVCGKRAGIITNLDPGTVNQFTQNIFINHNYGRNNCKSCWTTGFGHRRIKKRHIPVTWILEYYRPANPQFGVEAEWIRHPRPVPLFANLFISQVTEFITGIPSINGVMATNAPGFDDLDANYLSDYRINNGFVTTNTPPTTDVQLLARFRSVGGRTGATYIKSFDDDVINFDEVTEANPVYMETNASPLTLVIFNLPERLRVWPVRLVY